MEMVMKKIILTVASLGMAGSMAVYAQDQETTPYEPNRDIVTESQSDIDRSMGERQHDSPVVSDYDKESHDKTTQSGTADTQAGQYGQDETQAGQYGQADDGQYGDGMGSDLSGMTAEELEGKKVLTLTGEEVGEISDVGTSATQQARVATVEVGGFLGIGEKTIAIPLSELQSSVSDEDSVRTSMTRTSIEALPEFDENDFTADDERAY
jgi:sporulation protein YlmC with PRC-barrel domain